MFTTPCIYNLLPYWFPHASSRGQQVLRFHPLYAQYNAIKSKIQYFKVARNMNYISSSVLDFYVCLALILFATSTCRVFVTPFGSSSIPWRSGCWSISLELMNPRTLTVHLFLPFYGREWYLSCVFVHLRSFLHFLLLLLFCGFHHNLLFRPALVPYGVAFPAPVTSVRDPSGVSYRCPPVLPLVLMWAWLEAEFCGWVSCWGKFEVEGRYSY